MNGDQEGEALRSLVSLPYGGSPSSISLACFKQEVRLFRPNCRIPGKGYELFFFSDKKCAGAEGEDLLVFFFSFESATASCVSSGDLVATFSDVCWSGLPYCYCYLRVQNFAILGFRRFCGY